jgi:hypothetical protein
MIASHIQNALHRLLPEKPEQISEGLVFLFTKGSFFRAVVGDPKQYYQPFAR